MSGTAKQYAASTRCERGRQYTTHMPVKQKALIRLQKIVWCGLLSRDTSNILGSCFEHLRQLVAVNANIVKRYHDRYQHATCLCSMIRLCVVQDNCSRTRQYDTA